MKNTLIINQVALQQAGLLGKISPEEALFIDYLIGLATHPATETLGTDDGYYYWINYRRALEDLPILNSNSKITIIRIMNNLRNYGLINTKQDLSNNLYFCFTKKIGFLLDYETDPDDDLSRLQKSKQCEN